ncbi:MAG: hypothetical protein JWM11_2561 [Planctomycetaceae bacterium]|nr:hypothetical protein [Planctomycetaceae bacterium]
MLRGSFPSDYHKQIAQEAICDIKCVEMIVNAVEVASRGVSRELSAAQCSPCRSLLHTGSDNMSGFQGRVSLSVDSGSIRFEFTSSGKIGSAFAASFSQDCC